MFLRFIVCGIEKILLVRTPAHPKIKQILVQTIWAMPQGIATTLSVARQAFREKLHGFAMTAVYMSKKPPQHSYRGFQSDTLYIKRLSVGAVKLFHYIYQSLYTFIGKCIIHRGTETTHRAVTFNAYYIGFLTNIQKCLLF